MQFAAGGCNKQSSPKTQSALLKVMEEGCITLEGVTREIPSPHTVIAAQNLMGSAGTQLLRYLLFSLCFRFSDSEKGNSEEF